MDKEKGKILKIYRIHKRHSKNIKISWTEKKVIITSFRLGMKDINIRFGPNSTVQ